MNNNRRIQLAGIIFVLFILGSGCMATIQYYQHTPTDNLLVRDTKQKDFNELRDFVRNGVLFIPAFKTLRLSNPDPYAGIIFKSKKNKKLYLYKATLVSDQGATISEKIVDKTISINRSIEKNIFSSYFSFRNIFFENLNIKNLYDNYETLVLEIMFSRSASTPKSDLQKINFILRKVEITVVVFET